jgi:hypothetical protein
MSELISLFRKVSAEPKLTRDNGQILAARHSSQPAHFTQLLEYLRKQGRQQGRALRIAIDALADAN